MGVSMWPSSWRNSHVARPALNVTAIAAFQPKWVSMKAKSQFHWLATIRTGGAAKGVRVPPIEMLTNRTPNVTYFSRVDTSRANRVSRSIMAASVMAAGSVMKEPNKGKKARHRKDSAMPSGTGLHRAMKRTLAPVNSSTGRVPAITMMANTNRGSVNWRESR